MALAAKSSAVQVKLEATEGVDPAGWATSDVLPVSSMSEALNFEQIAVSEYGGSLDQGEAIAGAPKPTLTLRGKLRGSGVAATPMAPFSALMKCAQFAETTQAILPATGTFTATGSTANTITVSTSGSPG